MKSDWRDTAWAVVLCAMVALVAYLTAGCGATAIGRARTALEYTAEAGVAADRAVAAGYTEAAERELRNADSLAEYRNAMRPWDRAVESVEALYGALLTAESAVDAWEAGKAKDWFGVAGCVLGALLHMARSLDEVGVPVPAAAMSAIELLGAWGGACEVPS